MPSSAISFFSSGAQTGLPIFTPSEMENKTKIFNTLQEKRGFILEVSEEFREAVHHLFAAYHRFINSPTEEKEPFRAQDPGISGYFENEVMYGNKIGPRFYALREDSVLKTLLPSSKDGKGMQELNEEVYCYLDKIIIQTLQIIAEKSELSTVGQMELIDFDTTTSLHHNKPISQEKLVNWAKLGELTRTTEAQLESMSTHKDISALTVLVYRDNITEGLEVKPNKGQSYEPVNLQNSPGMKIVVLLGREIEHITPSLKGLSHRVVTQPCRTGEIYARDVINCFVFHPRAELRYQPQKKNPSIPAVRSFYEFLPECFRIQHMKKIASLTTEIADEIIDPYPKEDSIEQQQEVDGLISYRIK